MLIHALPCIGRSQPARKSFATQRPPSPLGRGDARLAFRRTGSCGKSTMEAAARFAGLDANGAWPSLAILSPAPRPMFPLKRRPVAPAHSQAFTRFVCAKYSDQSIAQPLISSAN
jgi:hypothetical protein